MTHSELVERAAKWLASTMRCSPVFTEAWTTSSGESPDAIGWGQTGKSVLVECKATMKDLYADRGKYFRRMAHLGVGVTRYYLLPAAMRVPADFDWRGWGLLRCRPRTIRRVHKSDLFATRQLRELQILRARYNALKQEGARGEVMPTETDQQRYERWIKEIGAEPKTCCREFALKAYRAAQAHQREALLKDFRAILRRHPIVAAMIGLLDEAR